MILFRIPAAADALALTGRQWSVPPPREDADAVIINPAGSSFARADQQAA
jgi:hypothetical protein